MENPNHVSNPSDTLWNLFGKSINIDAVKLIEKSWDEKKTRPENRKEAAD
jgi:hypothetical protein